MEDEAYLDLGGPESSSSQPKWLFQSMDRDRSEQLLQTIGRDGSFLVRSKPGDVEQYALSMIANGRPIHHLIERDGPVLLVNGRDFGDCTNLLQLIQYLSSQRPQLGWRVPLVHPVTVDAAAQVSEDYHLLWEAQTDDLYIDQDGNTQEVAAPPSMLEEPDPYAANARIALGAREGSRRTRFPKLSSEVTGQPESPPAARAGSAYDSTPVFSSSAYETAPPVIGAPPPDSSGNAAKPSTPEPELEKSSSFEDRSKRRSTLSNMFKSLRGKKKSNTDVSSGVVEVNVRLLGSANVDGISGMAAAQSGTSKITFITRSNPESIQDAELCVTSEGIAIRLASKAKTVLHHFNINELTYAFVDSEEPKMVGIITKSPTSLRGEAGQLVLMVADNCRGAEVIGFLQQALKLSGCPLNVHGPRSFTSNDAVGNEAEVDGLYAEAAFNDGPF